MKGFFFGWKTGFEPATLGTTNQCSNQLSYNHRVTAFCNAHANVTDFRFSTKIFINILKEFYYYFKSNKLSTATVLSTVNPSPYAVPIKRPMSIALFLILSVKFFVEIGVIGSLLFLS